MTSENEDTKFSSNLSLIKLYLIHFKEKYQASNYL